MARRKKSSKLTALAAKAKIREAYVPPARPDGTAIHPHPKQEVTYLPLTAVSGSTPSALTVLASTSGLAFFGGISALGLGAYVAGTERAPRFFQPAKIHATKGRATPTYKTSISGDGTYAKYTADAGVGSPSSFTAPLSAATYAAQVAAANTLFTALKGSVGGIHGRLWFTPEKALIAENGIA